MAENTKSENEDRISREDAQVGLLREVELDRIDPNPRNPRQTFDPRTIERLASSIEDIGLQVPITVYPNPDNSQRYILLDGERRFRAAKTINKPAIPALVVSPPAWSDNAVRMFNIHMLREEWREIETAWALEQIMEETGKSTERDLQKLTGLSIDRIRNMKRVLSFPKSQQQKVARGELPYQLLVELDKNVLSRRRAEQSSGQENPIFNTTVPELRDIFLKKFSDGPETDIVDLRRVGTLFDTAKKEGKVAERARSALHSLVTQPNLSIEDAYESGAAASVEIGKVVRDMSALPSRVEDLLESGIDDDQHAEVLDAIAVLLNRLAEVAKANRR